MPNANVERVDEIFPYLVSGMEQYEINTYLRECHFIAQLAHESGEFRYMEELASGKAYEGRKDLGNVNPGDGVRYKGRGCIQITGATNYFACGKSLGVDFIHNPELLETPEYASKSACWFWSSRGLNKIADTDNILTITKRINGGTNGLADRQKYLDRAKEYNTDF
jgi:putative chitinase